MVKLTPAMGWNSWNTYGSEISAELIKSTADKIVELGLKDAGYEYVVIDGEVKIVDEQTSRLRQP